MTEAIKVIRYELSNVVRGRWIVAYGAFFLILGAALLRFGGDDAKALLSLVNVVLFVVPLVSLVFGAMYLYSAREFNELLLAQPVQRRHLFAGLFIGVAGPLAAAVAVGIALPFAFFGVSSAERWGVVAWLAVCAALLTAVFVAIAFWIALHVEDRARGLGLALLTWLGLAILYDGLVLGLIAAFGAYPLERPVLALILLNPIDLARVLLLLRLDIAAMMGYTGAVFERFFGTALGLAISLTALTLWCAIPVWRGARQFAKKDF